MHKFIEVEFERVDFGEDLGNNLLEFFVVFVGWSVDYVCKLLLARAEMRLEVLEVIADVKNIATSSQKPSKSMGFIARLFKRIFFNNNSMIFPQNESNQTKNATHLVKSESQFQQFN